MPDVTAANVAFADVANVQAGTPFGEKVREWDRANQIGQQDEDECIHAMTPDTGSTLFSARRRSDGGCDDTTPLLLIIVLGSRRDSNCPGRRSSELNIGPVGLPVAFP